MFLRTKNDDERKRKTNRLGKQCWMFLKFSFTLEHEFADGVSLSGVSPPIPLILSCQVKFLSMHKHIVFWWLNAPHIYAGRGSESKNCLDSARHNSMFISIIFLTWFCLFVRSLGVITLCTSAVCFGEYRWIFFPLAANVASVEFLW